MKKTNLLSDFPLPLDVKKVSNNAMGSSCSARMGNVFLAESVEKSLKRIAPDFPEGWIVESDLNDLPPVFGHGPLVEEVFARILKTELSALFSRSGVFQGRPALRIIGKWQNASTVVRVEPDPFTFCSAPETPPFHLDSSEKLTLCDIMMGMNGFVEYSSDPSFSLYFWNVPQAS